MVGNSVDQLKVRNSEDLKVGASGYQLKVGNSVNQVKSQGFVVTLTLDSVQTKKMDWNPTLDCSVVHSGQEMKCQRRTTEPEPEPESQLMYPNHPTAVVGMHRLRKLDSAVLNTGQSAVNNSPAVIADPGTAMNTMLSAVDCIAAAVA